MSAYFCNLYSWRLSCRRLYRFEYGNNFTGGIIIFSRWRVSSTCNAPVIFLATLAKGYVLPIGAALLYLVPVVLIPSGIMGLHPLASVMGIYPYISSDAAEMVKKWAGGIEITISPNICLISLLVIGSISAIVSVLALRKQTY